MKRLLFLMLLFPALHAASQTPLIKPHEISADFGSLRNRYLFPITHLSYSSRNFTALDIIVSARLRSYGTLYFFSNSAYDFTPQAEMMVWSSEKGLYCTAGLGADMRLRVVKDVRSHAETSAEPMVVMSAHLRKTKFAVGLPLWTRFYSNGISFTVLPQFNFRLSDRWKIFTRYEISLIKIYTSDSEWRRDLFIGCGMEF